MLISGSSSGPYVSFRETQYSAVSCSGKTLTSGGSALRVSGQEAGRLGSSCRFDSHPPTQHRHTATARVARSAMWVPASIG
jgi:hypothetical protein